MHFGLRRNGDCGARKRQQESWCTTAAAHRVLPFVLLVIVKSQRFLESKGIRDIEEDSIL
jgi:hypothetical protein